MNHDLVYWSVAEVNRQNAGNPPKKIGLRTCPTCEGDLWFTHHGVDPQFASEYNPGEYVDFICAKCGYTSHESC